MLYVAGIHSLRGKKSKQLQLLSNSCSHKIYLKNHKNEIIETKFKIYDDSNEYLCAFSAMLYGSLKFGQST